MKTKFTLNNLNTLSILLISLTLLSASVPLVAKPTSEYQIELIIFKNNKNDDINNEAWTEPKLKVPENTARFQSLTSEGGNTSPDITSNSEYVLLNKDQLKYSNINNKLKYSHRYTPIAHIGWIQSKKEMSNSKPIYFNLGETYQYQSSPTPEIEGLISFSSKKFIHANLDLIYTTSDKKFSINETRRLKNKEINYFDHPAFAAIVIINELT